MQAIILAGGFGSRLKGVVSDLPKPMAPIRGVPFLSYILNQLDNNGFTKVILAVGYMGDKIQEFYGLKYKNIDMIEDIELLDLNNLLYDCIYLEKLIHFYI